MHLSDIWTLAFLTSMLTLAAKIPVFRKWRWAPFAGVAINLYWIWYVLRIGEQGLIILPIVYIGMWVWSLDVWWPELVGKVKRWRAR